MLVALNSVSKITKVSKSTSYEGGDIAGNRPCSPAKLGSSREGYSSFGNRVIGNFQALRP